MGRKYARVSISYKKRTVSSILAFIDTGADLSIIGRSLAKRLGIKKPLYERAWTASDGDKRYSPIVEVSIKAQDDRNYIDLDEVIIDDAPLDEDSKEEVILGLDYLQKAKKTLCFDD